MAALNLDQLVARFGDALFVAARRDRHVAGAVTVDELSFLAEVAARECLCIRADHPQAVPWCLACGDEQCLVHCIYCGADCQAPQDDQQHLAHCPNRLGTWPACPDMNCARCGNNIGALCASDSGNTLVCLGCAALPEDPDQPEGP